MYNKMSKKFCQKTNVINNNCSTPTKSYAYEKLVVGGIWKLETKLD